MTRLSTLFSLGIAAGASSQYANALSVPSSRDVGDSNPGNRGFLSFPIQQAQRDSSKVLRRRQTPPEDTSSPLFNVSFVGYLIELSIGTPGQPVKVAIDTGSDELWVNPDCNDSDLLPSQRRECRENGVYSPDQSSTSSLDKVVGPPTEEIQYGIGSVEMEYITDNIALPGSDISLESVQFAVATQTDDLNEGILGLSFGNDKNLVYNNLVDELFVQNVTRSRAFSVGLGNLNVNNEGVLIFGGIDTKKFTGDLMMSTIEGPQFVNDIHRYYVSLESIGIDRNGQTATYPNSDAVVVLDTGASFSYFPDSVLRAMARDIGGEYSPAAGLYLVPCTLLEENGTYDFKFPNGTIKIPIRDMVIQDTTAQACALAADAELVGSGIDMLLGDSFLRSVYVTFDQDRSEIGMAQYVNCGQNEQAITDAGAGGFKGECDPADQQKQNNAAGRMAAFSSSWATLCVGLVIGLLGAGLV